MSNSPKAKKHSLTGNKSILSNRKSSAETGVYALQYVRKYRKIPILSRPHGGKKEAAKFILGVRSETI